MVANSHLNTGRILVQVVCSCVRRSCTSDSGHQILIGFRLIGFRQKFENVVKIVGCGAFMRTCDEDHHCNGVFGFLALEFQNFDNIMFEHNVGIVQDLLSKLSSSILLHLIFNVLS